MRRMVHGNYPFLRIGTTQEEVNPGYFLLKIGEIIIEKRNLPISG
jgi:hypothetical protein